ncbi:MAG: sulfate/molybdate ABC transporter ATP-binding protein [Spirochaetales bacterium]
MSLKVDIHKRLGTFLLDSVFETDDPITGFLGPSGCGKSITLKCIAGIMTPDCGHIELDGRILYDSDKRICVRPQDRHVGYLFQSYALFPTMNVRKNIMCGLVSVKDRQVKEERYQKMVELLHLEGLDDHMPYQLSGGQTQRTAIARMLVSSPDLLLLDEPFSALDSYLRKGLQKELSNLLEKIGRRALLVTHSQSEVRKMCSRLYVMDGGRIIRGGATEEVFAAPNSERCALLLEE